MTDFNKWILVGRIVNDVEVKQTPNGKTVCSVRLAVGITRTSGEQITTFYYTCTAWEGVAEILGKARKGDRILLSGICKPREYQRRDGTRGSEPEMSVDDVVFLEPKRRTAFAPPSEGEGTP